MQSVKEREYMKVDQTVYEKARLVIVGEYLSKNSCVFCSVKMGSDWRLSQAFLQL